MIMQFARRSEEFTLRNQEKKYNLIRESEVY